MDVLARACSLLSHTITMQVLVLTRLCVFLEYRIYTKVLFTLPMQTDWFFSIKKFFSFQGGPIVANGYCETVYLQFAFSE